MAVRLNLRFPDRMRGQLAAVAKQNRRSKNSEIVLRLGVAPSAGATVMSVRSAKGSRNAEQAIVRMPDALHREIRLSAEASGRSLNAECIVRLAHSLGQTSEITVGQQQQQLATLSELRRARDRTIETLAFLNDLIERAS